MLDFVSDSNDSNLNVINKFNTNAIQEQDIILRYSQSPSETWSQSSEMTSKTHKFVVPE